MKRTTRFSALVCLMAVDTDKNACGSEKMGLLMKKRSSISLSHMLSKYLAVYCFQLLGGGKGPLEGHAGSLTGGSVGLESRLLLETEHSG